MSARVIAVWYILTGRPVAWRVTVRGRFVNDDTRNWLRYQCTELPAVDNLGHQDYAPPGYQPLRPLP